MADNNVVKFRVDTKEYDANVKRAGEVLSQYIAKAKQGGHDLKYLDDGVMDAVKAMGEMATKADSTRGALRELTQATSDMTVAYRSLTDEERNSPLGQEMAKSIAQMTERAGNAKDAMGDVSAAITHAASDTRGFDQAAGFMTGISSAFQTATGAAKMFGIEIGDNVEVLAQLQAAMAVTSGLQQLQNLLQSQSALMQGVNALQKEFNILAKANPYVLLATAAAAVVGAYYAWTSGAREAERAQKSLNAEIGNTKTQLDQIDKDTDFSVSIAEAAGKSWKAIHELRLEAARTKLQLADMNYDKLAASGVASAEQMKEAAQMQKQAWDGVMKVLNEGTIHDIQKRNGTGKKSTKSSADSDDATEIIGLINNAKEEVSDLQKRINEAPDETSITKLKKDLAEAKERLDELQNGVNIDKIFPDRSEENYDSGSVSKGQAIIDGIRNDMAESAKQADMSAITAIMETSIKNGIDGMEDIGKGLIERILRNDENIPDDEIQSYVDKLNEQLKEKFAEEKWPNVLISFDADTKSIETMGKKQQKEAAEMAKEWQAAGSAIQAVGSAMSQIEDPAAKVLGTIAQAVATMALSYAQAAKSKDVTGSGWGWIAFAATGMATMLSSIAAIKQATSGYAAGGIVGRATGGFVPGQQYSGDNIMANGGSLYLDAGELVLNRAQQGALADQLEGGGFGNMELDTRVSAEDIIFILNTNARRRGKERFIN